MIERPRSCPEPGVILAFDAGWNAHELGMDRDTVLVLTDPSGLKWALLGYDIRRKLEWEQRDSGSTTA